MSADAFVIGVDFGTDSVRSIVVNALDGKEVSSSVFYYPRWKKQLFCNVSQNQFRQHPLDYVEGLEHTLRDCVKKAGPDVAKNIKAISVDTTGSSPVAVDKSGTPLAMLPEFAENPNAMFVLWKDHTAVKEAQEINDYAATQDVNYLEFVGGIYSSEWFWAKILHILRKDEAVRKASYAWVEHCDWIPFLLTGGNDISNVKTGICAAGHKCLWAEEFNGFPPDEFFSSLDPLLGGITSRLYTETFTADQPAGHLSAEWAAKTGLSTDVLVGVGTLDAHSGAVGAQIEPYYLSKVMGTSTCDMVVAPISEVKDILVKGICGQVPGSIVPGMIGFEAGQSAFGDVYAWFQNLISWPVNILLQQSAIIDNDTASALQEEMKGRIISALSEAAKFIPLEENAEFAVDWLNGRRTPDGNQLLKGGLINLNLATDAPRLFRALVEATCFGAKRIADRYVEQGIKIKGLIGSGGVSKKSPYIMQVMADVMNMPIRIQKSDQASAMGAAMFAATVAGIYPKVEDAMKAMGSGFEKEYQPDPNRARIYEARYKKYIAFGQFIESQTPSAGHE